MACGVVPIASDAGGMRDVLADGENGFLFAAESREAAGEATACALSLDDASLRAMSVRVRASVEAGYSLDREIEALLTLFRAARP